MGFIAAGITLDEKAPLLIRGEATLAIGVVLAILSLSRKRHETSVALFALGSACAIDVKVTAIFYLVVPLYLLARRCGAALAALSAVTALILAVVPFAFAQFSLRYYVAWLLQAARHPLDGRLFTANMLIASILLAPSVMVFASIFMQDRAQAARLFRRNRYLLCLLGISLAGSMVTGSKLGAGPTHLNPWFIVGAYIATRLWPYLQSSTSKVLRRGLAVCTLVMIVPVVSEASELWLTAGHKRGWARQVNEDITLILDRNSGKSLAMSYESPQFRQDATNPLNTFSLRLVLAGNPLLVEEGALEDMGLSGLTIPVATSTSLSECQVQIWLAAKGAAPFDMKNVYAHSVPWRFPDKSLFDDAFRAAFLSNYHMIGSSAFYDLWECNTKTPIAGQRKN